MFYLILFKLDYWNIFLSFEILYHLTTKKQKPQKITQLTLEQNQTYS